VPVSLSYHASLKVDDVASWIGAGWSLNAGGVITRSVRGRPDEGANGHWTQRDRIDNSTTPLTQAYLRQVSNGMIDTEPDTYYYNVNGLVV
jgi:hypothetical protein